MRYSVFYNDMLYLVTIKQSGGRSGKEDGTTEPEAKNYFP